jgi:hypothetical protein
MTGCATSAICGEFGAATFDFGTTKLYRVAALIDERYVGTASGAGECNRLVLRASLV